MSGPQLTLAAADVCAEVELVDVEPVASAGGAVPPLPSLPAARSAGLE